MAGSPGDMLAAVQNAVQAINGLATTFPPITNVSTVVPGTSSLSSAISYSSSQVVGFGTVRTSSGGVYKIALLSVS